MNWNYDLENLNNIIYLDLSNLFRLLSFLSYFGRNNHHLNPDIQTLY